MGVLLFLNTR